MTQRTATRRQPAGRPSTGGMLAGQTRDLYHFQPLAMASNPTDDGLRPSDVAKTRLGKVVGGRWELQALLGLGGMAAVYQSADEHGKPVAVKVMHSEFSTNESLRQRFVREARLTQSIEHPAGLEVYDEGISDEGDPFFVMEMLVGTPLDRLWKTHDRKLPMEYSLRIADHVLDFLGVCHAENIIHRDLKPPNIFITESAQVKVLDFGVARKDEAGVERTVAGTALGTPAYMAPEQAMGTRDALDGRADIFSVGAILHALITGKKLHEGRSDQEAFVLAATRPAPSVARIAPDLPAEVVALIDRALQWDRRNRFPDALAMRQAIAKVLGTVASRPPEVQPNDKEDASRVLAAMADDATGGSDMSSAAAELEPVKEVFQWIERCLGAVRQYGHEHPHVATQLRTLHEKLARQLELEPTGFPWEVRPHSFMRGNAVVWEPVHPYDRIPYNLFASGFRHFSITPGITVEEIHSLLDLLRRDPSLDFAPEDDLATAFWEKQLAHVHYHVVDSFLAISALDAEADDEEAGQELEQLIASARDETRANGTSRTERLSLEARAAAIAAQQTALRAARASEALALSDQAKQTLARGLEIDSGEWELRFIAVLGAAVRDAVLFDNLPLVADPIRLAIYDHIKARTLAGHLTMLGRVAAVAAQDPKTNDAHVRLTRAVFDPETLRAVLNEVSRPTATPAEAAEVEACAVPLSHILAHVGSAPIDDVLESMGRVESPQLRHALMNFVAHHARGNEAKLGALLETASPAQGRAILAVLAELDTATAREALALAAKNSSAELRVEAVAVRAKASTTGLRDELTALSLDADPAVRTAALETMMRYRVKEAGPGLVQRITANGFHKLPVQERKLALETLYALSPARAETVALELAAKGAVIARDSVDETRIAAIELIARTGSVGPATEVLDNVSSKWSNADAVKSAASEAAKVIRERTRGRQQVR